MNATLRRMSVADIHVGMRLAAQNGWNQLAADWQRQLDLETDGCFVAELDRQVIGTACACVFDTVAWVNLVLVDQEHRGRGIGTALMRTVLTWLDQRQVPTIRLDATPLGRPIYEKLGFSSDYTLTRYEGIVQESPVAAGADRVTTAHVKDLPALVQLDRRATGTNREKLIRHLYERLNLYLVRGAGDLAGYAAVRPGARARHIGPCVGDRDACRYLLDTLAQALPGEVVFMDIPAANVETSAFATTLGLTPQRQLTRMTRGQCVAEQLDQYWCSFGPEKG